MKLVVAGSTGFVAGEVIRQALSNPQISSIVAFGRRVAAPVPVPTNAAPGADADATKLKSIVCDDFMNYPDSLKQELAGADACIWSIAVTPAQLKTVPWETTVAVCRDFAVKGIQQISEQTNKKPFRFVYISGHNAVRDPAQKPMILGDYCVLRGEAENQILEFAQQSNGAVEVLIAKPGIISGPGHETPMFQKVFFSVIGLPKIRVSHISATLIDQVINGFDQGDTLLNDDMVRLGDKILVAEKR
ncbi:hypothetical protein B0H63DRAFT_474761 [Podospora didyma]|uniref:NAD(P)-binding domain-containing protein n=1 Tax=Podospora didyma TaxID=330526 RepID=A0AAE0NGF1_9PEZI|nr:hypothetical protein B0H63DRAFT_474761 [Podospora didyma]